MKPSATVAAPDGADLLANVARVSSPEADESDLRTLVEGNSAFAFNLYQAVKGEEGNLFYSPHSLSLALGMLYAGAREETARQVAGALQFRLPQFALHPAFNALDLELAARAKPPAADGQPEDGYRLDIANGLWGRAGYPFLREYLDVVGANYDAGFRTMDFAGDPEGARRIINDWVSEQTENTIRDLLPEGSIHPDIALVLTNAIFFQAAWLDPFPKAQTADRPFRLPGGSLIETPTMSGQTGVGYAERDGYQAVELAYKGDTASMVVLLPDEGRFEQFEARLDAGLVSGAVESLRPRNVQLFMPKFEFDSSFDMKGVFSGMGMPDAFNPNTADLSGVNGLACPASGCLAVESAVHKAFVSVDEDGTKASAATGLSVGVTSLPPELRIDRPFVFLIRDVPTGAVLFVGRVLDPRA